MIAPAGFTGFENSENVGFADTPGGAFNINQPGLYGFVLEAFDASGALVDRTGMSVLVPEPAPFALVGLALAGLGLASRRKGKV